MVTTSPPAAPGLLDALLAPLVLSGLSERAGQAVGRDLADMLAKAGCPVPVLGDLSTEAAHEVVSHLRKAANLDDPAGLARARRFSDDLANAVEHGMRLGAAWLEEQGYPALPEGVASWLRGRLLNVGMVAAKGWAELVVETRAKVIPVEGHFGPRRLRLVSGSVDALPAEAWIVSCPPNAHDPADLIKGAAFGALEKRFGTVPRDSWSQMLRFDAGTPFWPKGAPRLDPTHDAYLARCGVWHVKEPWADKDSDFRPCAHLLALRNVPHTMFGPLLSWEALLRCWVDAIFDTLAMVAARSELSDAPRSVRTSLFTLRQTRGELPKDELLGHIVSLCLERLKTSPVVERLDIVFFGADEQAWLERSWEAYLRASDTGEHPEDDPVALELRNRCLEVNAILMRERARDTTLVRSLASLDACLRTSPAPNPTHLGFAARHAVEAIAMSLCRLHGRTPSDSLESNIETLSRQGGYARWFVSYLHTLRVLGNESVHVAKHGRRVLPSAIEVSDHVVLLASLARVLTVTRSAFLP